ncbi:MAG: FeoB-associated Cys-rich membrane protein [Lachnospiraceae bacterium]|nr:FeoB-associated Cys-rich membrane protein [Lachnospiraceae bacterium]
MNVWDILIIAVIAAAVFFGMRGRQKKGDSCCGSCSGCTAKCDRKEGNTPG